MGDDQPDDDGGEDGRSAARHRGRRHASYPVDVVRARLLDQLWAGERQDERGHRPREQDQRDEEREVGDDVREVEVGRKDREEDAADHRDHRGVDRAVRALVHVGHGDRQHAVEGQCEEHARDDGDKGQVDGHLRARHGDREQDLRDRVTRQNHAIAQTTRRGRQVGDLRVRVAVGRAQVRLGLHEVEPDSPAHEGPDPDPDDHEQRDRDGRGDDVRPARPAQLAPDVVRVEHAVVVQHHEGDDEQRRREARAGRDAVGLRGREDRVVRVRVAVEVAERPHEVAVGVEEQDQRERHEREELNRYECDDHLGNAPQREERQPADDD